MGGWLLVIGGLGLIFAGIAALTNLQKKESPLGDDDDPEPAKDAPLSERLEWWGWNREQIFLRTIRIWFALFLVGALFSGIALVLR